MNRSMLIIASLLLVGSMLAAHAQSDADSANGSATMEYRAIGRPDIEALGRRDESGVIHDDEALTRGLNKLAADHWQLTAIESASIRPIGGPAGGSASIPTTYVFSR